MQLHNWYSNELPALFSEGGVHSPSLPCPVHGESGLLVLVLHPGTTGRLFDKTRFGSLVISSS